MKNLLPYKIISYLLLPVAALFGMMVLFMFFMALADLRLMLPVFLLASVVIYVISSFIFLQKGIVGQQVCKHSLHDWIRVNAFVAIGFVMLMTMQSVAMLGNPKMLAEMQQQFISMQPTLPPGGEATVAKIIKGTFWGMVIFSGLLLIHIVYTFRLLKTLKHLFASK